MILHLLFFNLKQSLKIILRPHAPFHYSPLDLVFVSCAANLPLYHIVGAILSGYFFGPFQASECKGRSERGAQGSRAFLRRVCLSLHVHFVRRSPEKRKKIAPVLQAA